MVRHRGRRGDPGARPDRRPAGQGRPRRHPAARGSPARAPRLGHAVADDSERLRPTSLAVLAGVAGGGLLLGWFGVSLLERVYDVVPSVPWTSVYLLAFTAAALGATAWSTWRTIHRERGRLRPYQAVNRLVLGKASALVGAFVAGAYLGFGARFLDDLPAPLPEERVIRSALAALAAVLIVVAALLLERACRVPKDEDREGQSDGAPA
ncbi:MAG: DUF3180 family protein [Propionibacteriales bacterium]|nr:DUF3180 family protein [Propionibacteriales bacterium]